ncbi:hypothetical protein C8J56DRAFT_1133910 [Mycena floridula]|nr:hypothetical protein C8J56DRAFT_1133910 [Mycena floridula]
MSPSFIFDVHFTLSPGTNIKLLSPTQCGLVNEAGFVADCYKEVLTAIFGIGAQGAPGYLRLQHGFTAAFGGYNMEDWKQCSDEAKENLRKKMTSLYRNVDKETIQPPSLVIYIGPQREMATSLEAMETRVEKDAEYPWDPVWNGVNRAADLPCPWAWLVRHNNRRLIFISGFYALWDKIWARTQLFRDRPTVVAHLKTILYHESVDAARSLLEGTLNNTPEKIDDVSVRLAVRNLGEAGQLAERMALGYVVDLHLETVDDVMTLTLYTCDQEDPERTAYALTPDHCSVLFHCFMSSPLPSPNRSTMKILNIPMAERCKDWHKNMSEESFIHIEEPIPLSSFTYSATATDHLFVPITGPLGEQLMLEDAINHRDCIVRDAVTISYPNKR